MRTSEKAFHKTGWKMGLGVGCLLAVAAGLHAANSEAFPAPMPLENTNWVFTQSMNESGVFPSGGKQVTLYLDAAKKEASGSGGCNTFTAPYTLTQGKVTFGMITSTKVACSASGDEAGYFAMLGVTTGFDISGIEMHLLNEDGVALGVFRASALDPGGVPKS